MKKSILFLGLLGGLISCDKLFDDTPKCDDKEVVKLVEELEIEGKNYWPHIYDAYYDDNIASSGMGHINSKQTKLKREVFSEELAKKYGLEVKQVIDPMLIETDVDLRNKIYEEINAFNKKLDEEVKEKGEYLENNYQTDSKIKEIYDSYYTVTVTNIRPISSDKESKKCECEATLNLGKSLKDNVKEVYYTAQKNTDGQIYVELLNL